MRLSKGKQASVSLKNAARATFDYLTNNANCQAPVHLTSFVGSELYAQGNLFRQCAYSYNSLKVSFSDRVR